MFALLSSFLVNVDLPAEQWVQSSGDPAREAYLVREVAQNTEALCTYLNDRSDELADTPTALVKVGRVTYPVVNAFAQFQARPGGQDATQGLQAALGEATTVFGQALAEMAPAERYGPNVVFLPTVDGQSTYHYNQVLTVGQPNTIICGVGITLMAEQPDQSSIVVTGDNVHIHGLHLRGQSITQNTWPERWEGEGYTAPTKFADGFPYRGAGSSNASGFVLRSDNIIVSDTDDLGGVRGGFRLYGATNVLLYGNRIERAHSDSIHITHESSNITVRDNLIINSGDDCISVVPYNAPNDGNYSDSTVENVLVENNVCQGSRTRGLTAIGGRNLVFRDNLIEGTLNTGILVFPADEYTDEPAQDISILNNIIKDSARAERLSHLSGIGLIGGQENNIVNVLVAGNEIYEVGPRAFGSIRIKHSNSCCAAGDTVSIVNNTAYGHNVSLSVDEGYDNLYVEDTLNNGRVEDGFGLESHATGGTYAGVVPEQVGHIGDIRILTYTDLSQ